MHRVVEHAAPVSGSPTYFNGTLDQVPSPCETHTAPLAFDDPVATQRSWLVHATASTVMGMLRCEPHRGLLENHEPVRLATATFVVLSPSLSRPTQRDAVHEAITSWVQAVPDGNDEPLVVVANESLVAVHAAPVPTDMAPPSPMTQWTASMHVRESPIAPDGAVTMRGIDHVAPPSLVNETRIAPSEDVSSTPQWLGAKHDTAVTPSPLAGAAATVIDVEPFVRHTTSPLAFEPANKQPLLQHPAAEMIVDGAVGVATLIHVFEFAVTSPALVGAESRPEVPTA